MTPMLNWTGLKNKPNDALDMYQKIIIGIAWMADNEGYGIKEAARDLIKQVITLRDRRIEPCAMCDTPMICGDAKQCLYGSRK